MDFDTFLAHATPECWSLRYRHKRPGTPVKDQQQFFRRFPDDRDLEADLEAFGFAGSGTFHVSALARGTAAAKEAERERLGLQEGEKIAGGELAYVRADGRDDPPPSPPPAPPTPKPTAVSVTPSRSPSLSDELAAEEEREQHELRMLELRARRRRLERELGDGDRGFDHVAAAPQAPGGSRLEVMIEQLVGELRSSRSAAAPAAAPPRDPAQWVAVLTAVGPFIGPVVQNLLEGRSRILDEFLGVLKGRVTQDPSETIIGLLKSVSSIRELAGDLVPNASASGPFDKIMELVGSALQARAAEQPAPAPDQQQQQTVGSAAPDPMVQRSHGFAALLHREMIGDSDPGAVADATDDAFRLLPRKVRDALIAGDPGSWEHLCGRPGAELSAAWVQSPPHRAWLEGWRLAVNELEAPDDDGGPWDDGDRGYREAASGEPPPGTDAEPRPHPIAPWPLATPGPGGGNGL